jgi:outer membrane lipoprotein carrier protein
VNRRPRRNVFARLPGVIVTALCAGASVCAQASAIDRLHSFIEDTKTLRAAFTQAVLDKDGKRLQESSGTLALARPGKFRWNYEKPYQQLIVGDGKKVWIYDSDLNQVTVRKLDAALGSTPAALLAGSNEIERAFTLVAQSDADGLQWLEATPKAADSTFATVRMGFDAKGLSRMQLRDHFSHTTMITLSKSERNVSLPPDLFKFTAPKGADVIGD